MAESHYALLRAVLENPEDDTVRLVYADWLDENDQPKRAELIRAQVKLARGAFGCKMWMYECGETLDTYDKLAEFGCSDCGPYGELKLREQCVLADCAEAWAPVGARAYTTETEGTLLNAWSFTARFRRGWVDKVRASPDKFLSNAELWFSRHPITEVVLNGREAPVWRTEYSFGVPEGAVWWFEAFSDDVRETEYIGAAHHIPKTIFRLLDGYLHLKQGPAGNRSRFYPNQTAAFAALSRACVRYGRQANKLPEIFPAQGVKA
jgi:uncharacterized protein (TIGR02996 family)